MNNIEILEEFIEKNIKSRLRTELNANELQALENLIQENKELKEKINKSIEFINNDNTFLEDGENWQNVLHIERILKGKSIMKEMEYSEKRKIEVLDKGYCLGFLYYIMNLGTHPTAYIKIPKDHKYYGKDMGEIELDVNGGVTYSNEGLNISKNQRIEGWFVGWDYAHCGDYTGFELIVPKQYRIGGKKWTTKEIYEEVRQACYQLNQLKGEQS